MLRMTNSARDDGELAEIQTVGIEGIEKNLLLKTIQTHRGDTSYSCKQFQDKLPVGTRLDICTTIEVTTVEADTHDLDDGAMAAGTVQNILLSNFLPPKSCASDARRCRICA